MPRQSCLKKEMKGTDDNLFEIVPELHLKVLQHVIDMWTDVPHTTAVPGLRTSAVLSSII